MTRDQAGDHIKHDNRINDRRRSGRSIGRSIIKRRLLLACAVVALAVGAATAPIAPGGNAALAGPETGPEPERFAIEAQSLGSALKAFAAQAGVQIMYTDKDVTPYRTKGLSGEYSRDKALAELLAGTGLEFEFTSENTLVVRPVRTSARSSRRTLLAQLQETNRATDGTRRSGTDEAAADDKDYNVDEESIEELIVTGSHIRGVRSASPVFIYTREDIDRTGASTVPQFIQTLPQNFGGGVSESTFGVVPSGNSNINGGTGINLRGLGNDSTLVLLNGRRLAPAGLGTFVDISMIPLSAIERIEVLTDGASAIYGSDAVGGVVNFKMREDYDGAETRLRYGSATTGDLDEIQIGQTFGKAWGNGHALISYEYQKRDELDANDKAFTQDAIDPTFLLPRQKRHSVFLTAGQNLSDTVDVFGDAFYSKRDSQSLMISRGLVSKLARKTEQYGVSLGSGAALSENWRADLVGVFSQNDVSGGITRFVTSDFTEIDSFTELTSRTSTTWSLDGKVDGTLFRMSGGEVKLAVGGQYRHEAYKGFNPSNSANIDEARNIYAFFGEMFVPLVGKENRTTGVERLELTVAGRYEDYSDFGSSTDSKLGLLWSPIEGINFRGTWGTSFRVPLFSELDTITSLIGFLLFFPDPTSPSGTTLAVLARGNNPDLQPETATTWTTGIDIQPPSVPGLNVQATYFNIDFKDRIDSADALFDAFTDPRWAPVVDRSPDPELLALLGSLQGSQNFTGGAFEFTDAEALIDDRLRNLARVQTSGLDFSLSYALDSDLGSLGFSLGGTYLFEQLEQLIETDEPFDLVGTVFNPPDLKLRSSISWGYEGFTTNFAVNYMDGFSDERVDPVADVSSWTTVDLNISYNTGDLRGLFGNTTFSLSALNLFDRDPPFVASFFGREINYDPANASPVGRAIAFQITKSW